jgi:aromatic-L-amino-acid decarboxylase
MLEFPPESGGLLTSGGSLATLVALVTARHERLPPEFQRGVLYVSREVHHAVTKSAYIAGFLRERVRVLPTDSDHRLSLDALRSAIAGDRRDGLEPFCVVGSAGAVNTGTVDDLKGLATIARQEGLWFHVDAAYGGFFALTERGRRALRGIELADSVVLDPHKGLFLPYGTGCVLVRDRRALDRAHAVRAAYLPPRQEDDDVMDFCDMGPELSRDARGLRVWLPLKMHGAATFREALDEKLDLAAFAAAELEKEPDIELAHAPTLSLFAWRYRPQGLEASELDACNRRLLTGVNQRQRVLLTGTTLEDGFYLRLCVLSFRTHRERIAMALEDIRAELAVLRSETALPPEAPSV